MKKTARKKHIVALLILLAGNLLLFLTIWLLEKYDNVSSDQILFQIKSPASGANNDLMSSAVVRVGGFGIVLTAIENALYLLLSGGLREKFRNHCRYRQYCSTKLPAFFRKSALVFAVAVLMMATEFFVSELDVIAYIDTVTTESDFIEEHYVDPYTVELEFPQKKRNLIYIFLESMESTYADVTAGGSITEDFIPELTALAKENTSFSNTDGIGGALSFNGTTWTAAAMVAQTCGVLVKVPLTADNYGGEDEFIPGVISIGEILEKQGYHQTLLLGSDASFAGRDSYFTQHGNYEILDINALKEAGRLPEDYEEWWGFEDRKLFAYAKEELLRLSEEEEPFNFTMLTADTHFPDGYSCPLCEDAHQEQYANVLCCSSRQVAELVDWIKEQPFYENTTIIICGDHLTMDPEFLDEIDENYERTIYNCIINAPIEPVCEENRQFGTFDMFPTTLAALGVRIEGERLGLGTNLFSEEQTLTEQYGFLMLDEELQKNSVFYNTQFLEMDEE
ncbi:MAG: LTA synthase family protein [Lachnospiraceae bacterium]|nr:LTA synthase family protein [Lachnospiraceae bacterium]